ncbi:MAG TPA: hypothetical protein VLJ86_10755 [Ramlibacter sp.]|nr:hypothetical protein [Ramlibacter sp.]
MHTGPLAAIIDKVHSLALVSEQRWTVCVKGSNHEPMTTVRLGSQREVSELTLALERLGYELLVDDPYPSDFVFELQLHSA